MAGLGLFGMFLFLTYYLQETLGYSALKCGIAYLPFSAGIVVAAGVASKLLPETGPRPLMTGGFLAAAGGLAWLTQIGLHTSYVSHVLPAEILISLGLGFAFVSLSSTALIGVDDHDAGVASAMVNTTQQVGGSLGTALLNTIATSATANYLLGHGHRALPTALVHGYTVAFIYGAAALGLAAIASATLVRTSRQSLPAGETVLAMS